MARRQEGAVVVRQPGLHRDQRLGDCVLDGAPDVLKAVAVAPHPLPASSRHGVTDSAACRALRPALLYETSETG